MKKNYLILVFYVLCNMSVKASDKYWIGALGGNWNSDKNWSLTSGGIGGAGRPKATDAVIFSGKALVSINVSPIIYSLRTSFGSSSVTLFTSTGSTLTILSSLRVEPSSILKDSTSANVPFNVVFNGASHATANIIGDWIFEGGVPITGSNNGARFTAESGSLVTVATSPLNITGQGGRIVVKKNTMAITSSASTLRFAYGSYYILDNNLNPSIPAATWAKDSAQGPSSYSDNLGAPASTIQISGNMGPLQFLGGVPNFGRLVLDLSGLTADATLALPDGSKILGNLDILNTNNQTLTLLASTSATSSVQVEVGNNGAGNLFGGYLNISGARTKVALAKATSAAPETSYKLLVNKSFNQSGGNFSLQDYNNVTGSSILAIKNDLIQTSGTFITNSTSTSSTAKFMVVMDDPNYITGPSGGFSSLRTINMSSGNIDNARHVVTLRIDHTIYSTPGFSMLANGVMLQSPLTVGKLELARAPLTTSTVNILTVSNPSSGAITVGKTGKSFVNGPLRRATNSIKSYCFPTGVGNSSLTSYYFDSCSVVPATVTPSVYQVKYSNTVYPNLTTTVPLLGISNSGYWDIGKISGSDAQVRLTLKGSVNGASASDGLVVAQYVSGHWISEHGSVLTPGNKSGGSVLSKQLSSFSSFTFGYVNPAGLNTISGSGLTYKFYQGSFDKLPDFNALSSVATGTSSNVDISVRPINSNDGFAFMWQGYINIPVAGTYNFETVSDDGSKLYFNTPYSSNATALVSNDGSHAAQSATGTVNITTAGTYPVTITYFENTGGESMQVYWSGPGFSRQQIPDIAFISVAASPAIGALNYKYYEGDFNLLPDYATLTPIKTGTTANINLGLRTPGVNDYYAFIWDGYINLPSAGTYTFETLSDDGSKVYINLPYSPNGASTVSNDGMHAATSATGTVTVAAAGKYPVTITFFEKDGGETMQLYWSGPGISRQLVPDAAFSTTNSLNNVAVLSTPTTNKQKSNLTKDVLKTSVEPKIYPNPFVESFTLDYDNPGKSDNRITIGIYDLYGKLIDTYKPVTLVTGNNKWIINLGSKNVAAGVYIVQLNVNGIPDKSIKLVKTKR